MKNVLPEIRVGQGFDIHRFAEGRRLILGGVDITHSRGLLGHSDADVLLHSIADAILGAAGLPDIGHFFPNTDNSIRDINSALIVKRAAEEVRRLNWEIANIDCSLLAERPKISPYLQSIKENIAQATGISQDRVGVKATTCEKLGAIGREEGIAALSVVLLMRAGSD